MRPRLFLLAITIMTLVVATLNARADEPAAMSEIPQGDEVLETSQPAEPAEPAKEAPAFFRLDYSGDFLTAPALTGDWGGLRNDLAEDGISFRVEVLQFGMGNARGGKNTTNSFEYSGSADYILQLDTGRMGLWPGGFFNIRGETGFGRNVMGDVGSVSPYNFDALFPAAGDPGLTTLTEAYAIQFLSEKLFLLGGKVDLSRLPGQNEFAGDVYGQFLNTSMWQAPNSFLLVPYNPMAAGIGYMPVEWFSGATMVLDSYSQTTRTGFDTAFHTPNGATLLQTATFNVKPFGLKGAQRLNVAWSSRDRYRLKDLDRLFISESLQPSFSRVELTRKFLSPRKQVLTPRKFLRKKVLSKVLAPGQQSDNWTLWYDFDQYLYQEQEDPTQGVGIFGRFGWSPGDVNPVATYYNAGIGGKGIIPTRDKDRFGIGWYMINLSDDLPRSFADDAEQGVELFYNIEVTPWLHITPDVQYIVNPGGSDERDAAIAYGIRAQISF